jgi:hypothetical protein
MWKNMLEDDDLIAVREISIGDEKMVALIRVTDWEADPEESKVIAAALLIGGTPLAQALAQHDHQDPLLAAFDLYFFEGSGAMCHIAEKFFPADQWDEAIAWAKAQIDKPEFPVGAYLDALVNQIGTTGREAMEGNLLAGLDRGGIPFRKGKPVRIQSGEDVFGPSAPAHVRSATAVSYEINSSELDSSCLSLQVSGLVACEHCQYVHTEHCGGPPEVKITHRRFAKKFPGRAEDMGT